jgi:hypothetical protein
VESRVTGTWLSGCNLRVVCSYDARRTQWTIEGDVMTQSHVRLLTALFLLIVVTNNAHGDPITSIGAVTRIVLYDTVGPGDVFAPGGQAATANQQPASPFVPAVSARLHSIALVLALDFPERIPTVIVTVRGDADGLPGNVLEQFVFRPTGSWLDPNPPVVGLSRLTPLLVAGSTYWVAAATTSEDTDVIWMLNPFGHEGPAAVQIDGEWHFNPEQQGDGDTSPAFRVVGTTEVASVPESTTLVLLSAAGVAGGVRKWKLRERH